ncbi:hypothetical protein CRENBAI_005070 [Crenichthys baileyi]|uniref:Uncharacterized protein n=1 Tax=Crenichthys baileyi TaxID=28760 RepID=A0AAV9QVX7_9TELE
MSLALFVSCTYPSLFLLLVRIQSIFTSKFLCSAARLPRSSDPRINPLLVFAVNLCNASRTFLLKTVRSFAQLLTSHSPACPPSDTICSTAYLLLKEKGKLILNHQSTKHHHLPTSDSGSTPLRRPRSPTCPEEQPHHKTFSVHLLNPVSAVVCTRVVLPTNMTKELTNQHLVWNCSFFNQVSKLLPHERFNISVGFFHAYVTDCCWSTTSSLAASFNPTGFQNVVTL